MPPRNPDLQGNVPDEENRNALEQMKKVLKADTTPSERLDVEELKRRGGAQAGTPPS